MNWYVLMKTASDPLANLRMLVDNGLKQQLSSLKRDPRLSKFFTSHSLQSNFVACDAAVTKLLELADKYRDYKASLERARAAYASLMSLCTLVHKQTGTDISKEQIILNIVEDLRDVAKELSRLDKSTAKPVAKPAPTQAKPTQPNPAAQQPNSFGQPMTMTQPAPAAARQPMRAAV